MQKVSVIIPSYNHAKYISAAVNSVLDQSYTNLELIVVDDGSRDSSVNFLRTIRDSRFKLIEQENQGAHHAINVGLMQAQGEYLAILNSDDMYHRARLEECVNTLRNDVDLVTTWLEVINDKGKSLGVKEGWKNMLPWVVAEVPSALESEGDFTLHLLQSNFVSTTSNIVFSRSVYENIGGMQNLRFAHDWDFLLRAANRFRCALINKPLVKYRIHGSNTISSNRKWMLFEICWIYARHLADSLKSIRPDGVGAEYLAAEVEFMASSINLQGNDRVFSILAQLFASTKEGDKPASQLVLEDAKFRDLFVNMIV